MADMNEHPEQQVWLVRHAETEWSRSGRHTGRTDVPLTDAGRERARALGARLAGHDFAQVLVSPLERARETARLAGLGDRCEVREDLLEWDYGDYEGITTAQIRERVPGWTVWSHPCPHGETAASVSARMDRVLATVRAHRGRVLAFSHGHASRALAARWLAQPVQDGRFFKLGTATVSVLGYEHGGPVVDRWNS